MNKHNELVFIINDPVVGLGLLRTARLSGYRVNVIARLGCRWLRWTSACQQFFEVEEERIENDLVNVIREHGFDQERYLFLAAGDIATGALLAAAKSLKARTQSVMDAESRARLGNKASFAEVCRELSIPIPQTWVVDNKRDLEALAAQPDFSFPVIVKAVNMSGNIGIRIARDKQALTNIINDPCYDFAPLVIQDFIAGEDACFSFIAKEGQIQVAYGHRCSSAGVSFPAHAELYAHAEALCKAANYSGPGNLDVRLGEDGGIYLIECNARFWASNPFSYLVGLDLIAESGFCPDVEAVSTTQYVDEAFYSFTNAVKGVMSKGPLSADKALRYLRSIFCDMPGYIFTKLPVSRRFFAF
jgi:predicted ATP-grasp superfamily ATP-dependent carboligase